MPAIAEKIKSLIRLPLKRSKLCGLRELALKAGRGDLEGLVGSGDQVVYVKDGAEVATKLLAVFVGDSRDSLDEDAAGPDGDGLGRLERVAGFGCFDEFYDLARASASFSMKTRRVRNLAPPEIRGRRVRGGGRRRRAPPWTGWCRVAVPFSLLQAKSVESK